MQINKESRQAKRVLPMLGAQSEYGIDFTHLGVLLYFSDRKEYILTLYGCERKDDGRGVLEKSMLMSSKNQRRVLAKAPRYSAKELAGWAAVLDQAIEEQRTNLWEQMVAVAASYGATLETAEVTG